MGILKKVFYAGLAIFSSVNLLTVSPLRCISMNNQKLYNQKLLILNINIKYNQKLLMLIMMSLHFILLVLKQGNAVVVVLISIIYEQKYVFLML